MDIVSWNDDDCWYEWWIENLMTCYERQKDDDTRITTHAVKEDETNIWVYKVDCRRKTKRHQWRLWEEKNDRFLLWNISNCLFFLSSFCTYLNRLDMHTYLMIILSLITLSIDTIHLFIVYWTMIWCVKSDEIIVDSREYFDKAKRNFVLFFFLIFTLKDIGSLDNLHIIWNTRRTSFFFLFFFFLNKICQKVAQDDHHNNEVLLTYSIEQALQVMLVCYYFVY